MSLVKKNSGVHGIGIFTDQAITKGEVVYIIPLAKIVDNNSFRYVCVGDNKFVNDEDVLNWINHCCRPSAKLITGKNPYLLAIKDISIGEEITIDYNETQKVDYDFYCSCGQDNCHEKIGKRS